MIDQSRLFFTSLLMHFWFELSITNGYGIFDKIVIQTEVVSEKENFFLLYVQSIFKETYLVLLVTQLGIWCRTLL